MNRFSPDMLLYTPAIALEQGFPRWSQKVLHVGLIVIGTGVIVVFLYSQLVSPLWFETKILGGGALVASLLLTLSCIRAFHNSYYYKGFEQSGGNRSGLTYEVARIFYLADGDVTGSFIRSPQGHELTKRLGLTEAEITAFIESDRTKIALSQLPFPEGKYTTFKDLGLLIYEYDPAYAQLLSAKGLTDKVFMATLEWTTRAYYSYKHNKRWWSRDNLSKFAGLGRDWSYGVAHLLKRFSRNLADSSVFSHLITNNPYASEQVDKVEQILARTRESNALLIGKPGVGKMDILLRVAERIRRKVSLPQLHDRKFIVLDTDHLLAQFDSKQELERNFITMMQQAASAGNLIVVIEKFSSFVRGGVSVGVDIPALIEPYLNAPELKLVFTDTPDAYHHDIEQLALLQKTETLFIDPPNLVGVERLLEDIAHTYERRYHITLTYPALQAIALGADRYIPTGVMPDKAVDLLIEIMGAAAKSGSEHVTEAFVQTYVHQKTGVPVGPIDDSERDMLLELEERLHRRVVGQEAAITAIASAMRRARAGIQDSDRPLGSFLFLGPTGVGKTETAKALATVFFGNDDSMIRIDMSEFSGPDGLVRLIGTKNTPGVLANAMQEHPYAVVLLDEFEKASNEVRDLFLQILDEGRFTDGRGNTVNMRNTIVIATSNAGSGLIIEAVRAHTSFESLKETIIDAVIREGVYRPELINRFDASIIFKPLTIEEQKIVSGYLLKELQSRVADRGYTLHITDELIQAVALRGYNPEFGARPMRRVIQDQVEEVVARKIIAGEIQKGGVVEINTADFSEPTDQ